MNRTLDTNVVQTLYIMLNRPNRVAAIEKNKTTTEIICLRQTAKKLMQGKKEFYITPQVMKEIEMTENKYPGIINFARNNFLMNITTSPQLIQTIIDLEDEYLKEDIYLNDSTRAPQSAIYLEEDNKKDGLPNRADAHIVAENNVINGYPLFSLNEKHLICMKNSQKPNSPQRSAAILNKNKGYLKSHQVHKVAKKNLKKLTSTTFKVKNINRNKDDLINAFIQEL